MSLKELELEVLKAKMKAEAARLKCEFTCQQIHNTSVLLMEMDKIRREVAMAFAIRKESL